MNIQPMIPDMKQIRKEALMHEVYGENKEAAERSIKKYSMLFRMTVGLASLACFLISMYLCFKPVAKIGPVSMGNSVELMIDMLDQTSVNGQYLPIAFGFIGALTILLAVFSVFPVITYLCLGNIGLNYSWKRVITTPIFSAIVPVIIYFVLNSTTEYYGCSIVNFYVVCALICVPNILSQLVGCILSSVDKDFKETSKAGISYVNKLSKANLKKRGWVLVVCFSIMIVGLTGIGYLVLSNGGGEIDKTRVLINSSCEVDYLFESGYIEVGKSTTTSRISVDSQKDLVIDFTSDDKTWIEYGDNYIYYQNKIAELAEERDKLNCLNISLVEYYERTAELQEQIDYLKEAQKSLPYSYALLEFGNREFGSKTIVSYTHNRNINYCDEDGKKWGYSDGSIMSKFIGESITLSTDSFNLFTDFSTAKIIATVVYSDGSKKVSKITPTNWEELNDATRGTHVLKWADEWGEYETTIKIN